MIAKKAGIALVSGFLVFLILAAGCTTPAPPTVTPEPTAPPTLEPITPEPTEIPLETPLPPVETPTPRVNQSQGNTTKVTPTHTQKVSTATDTDFLIVYDASSRALSDTIARLTIALAGSSVIGDIPPAFPDVLAQSKRLVMVTQNATNEIEPMTELKEPQNQKLQVQYLNYTASLNVAGQALVEAANLSIKKDYITAIRYYRDADGVLANTVAFPDPDNTKDLSQMRYYIEQVISSLENRMSLEKEKVTNKP